MGERERLEGHLEKKKTPVLAVAKANKKVVIRSYFFLTYGLPALFFLGMTGVSSVLSFAYGRYYENPFGNIVLAFVGSFIMSLALSLHFRGYRKILGSVFLVFENRIVAKNSLLIQRIPRSGTVEIRHGDFFFSPIDVYVDGKRNRIWNFPLSRDFIQRAEKNGIRVTRDPKAGLLFLGLVLTFIATCIALSRFSQDKTFLLFTLLAVIIGLVRERNPSIKQRPKSFMRRIYWSRENLHAGICMAVSIATIVLSGNPLSAVDRKISEARDLAREGHYLEALKNYEELESIAHKPMYKNDYAWFLSVVPDLNYRDPRKAIRLSEEALSSAIPAYSKPIADTYACSLMANGDRAAALEVTTKYDLKKRKTLFDQDKPCSENESFAARSIASEKK